MIYSSLYIIIKYNIPLITNIPLIMINIPLIIAYQKKHAPIILSTTIIIIAYNYMFYKAFLPIIILEYILYYLLYQIEKQTTFIIHFATIKAFLLICTLNIIGYQTIDKYIGVITISLCLALLSLTILYLNKKANSLLKLHKSINEILKEKEIKTSLFKITHEIKNPIAVCKGYLDMFDPNNQTHAKKYIPVIKQEINKTLILLEDFLSMNKLKLNKDILDINLLLKELLNTYTPYLKKQKITLSNKINDDEIYINGDYNRLNQVFLNLLKNSIESLTTNKNIEIWTKIKNKKIQIFIKDSGVGMNKETLEKIKQPFYTTKSKGNGLGVALSNEIIKAHKGTLEYQSKLNQYTITKVTLPITNIYN